MGHVKSGDESGHFCIPEISKKILCSPFTELGFCKKVMVPLLPKYGNSVKIEQNDHDDEGLLQLLFLNQSSSKLLMLWSVHLPFQFEYIYHLTYAAFT